MTATGDGYRELVKRRLLYWGATCRNRGQAFGFGLQLTGILSIFYFLFWMKAKPPVFRLESSTEMCTRYAYGNDQPEPQSLGGGGYTLPQCTNGCGATRGCEYFVFYQDTGYCHYYTHCGVKEYAYGGALLFRRKHEDENSKYTLKRADLPPLPPPEQPAVKNPHAAEAVKIADLVRSSPRALDEEVDLLFMVPSHFSEASRRCAIRDSWQQYLSVPGGLCPEGDATCEKPVRGRLVFTIGHAMPEDARQAVLWEQEDFGDLAVMAEFAEEAFYKKRSNKTRASIAYLVENFKFKLLVKSDTDSFVNVPRLISTLNGRKIWEKERVYMGNFVMGKTSGVMYTPDKSEEKWYDPGFHNETGLEQYPLHAKGPGYILSRDLAEYIARPPAPLAIFTCEDTAVGIWLTPVQHEKIALMVELGVNCQEKAVVIDHYVHTDAMRARWLRYLKFGEICPNAEDYTRVTTPFVDARGTRLGTTGAFRVPVCTKLDGGQVLKPVHLTELEQNPNKMKAPPKRPARRGVCALSFRWAVPKGEVGCVACMGSDGKQYDPAECEDEIRVKDFEQEGESFLESVQRLFRADEPEPALPAFKVAEGGVNPGYNTGYTEMSDITEPDMFTGSEYNSDDFGSSDFVDEREGEGEDWEAGPDPREEEEDDEDEPLDLRETPGESADDEAPDAADDAAV